MCARRDSNSQGPLGLVVYSHTLPLTGLLTHIKSAVASEGNLRSFFEAKTALITPIVFTIKFVHIHYLKKTRSKVRLRLEKLTALIGSIVVDYILLPGRTH